MGKEAPKRRPRDGQRFNALIVGGERHQLRDTVRLLGERIGVRVRWVWRQSDSPLPLDKRALPIEADVVIIVRDSSIARQERERLDHRARTMGMFAVQQNLSPKEVCQLLASHGIESPDLLTVGEPELAEIGLGIVEIPTTPEPAPAPATAAPPAVIGKVTPIPTLALVPVVEDSIPKAKDLKAAGAEIQKRREAREISRKRASKDIGVSDSYIAGIEGGKQKPAAAVCALLEKYYGLPAGFIPRLAKRDNHRISTILPNERQAIGAPATPPPPKPPAAVAPPPPPAPPEPPPEPAAVKWARALALGADVDPKREGLARLLVSIQGELANMGIDEITITPHVLTVRDRARADG